MSVKSTLEVTRKRIIDHISSRIANLYTEKLAAMTDAELEDLAEELDERAGDVFTNYLVIKE